LAHVSAAVHAKHVPLVRKNEIENTEDAFLYFTGVTAAGDQDHLVLERNYRCVVLADSALLCIESEAGCGDDMPLGSEAFKFLFGRTKEHVVGKEVVPWLLVHEADVHPVPWVGAGIAIANPEFRLLIEIGHDVFVNDVEV